MDRIYNNATEAFVNLLDELLTRGQTVTVRGMETKELRNVSITLRNPLQRCYVLKNRNNNTFANIAETLWMLAGRDDIEWLSYYLPRAPEFSDNGRTWRGAYGPRLRAYSGADNTVDQLAYVVDLLTKDPFSRQAVISIWDPAVDTLPGKDHACNNWIHFYIREEDVYDFSFINSMSANYMKVGTVRKLHMNVAQRSSDLIWGFSGNDTFSWSILHQMMAHWLGVEVGEYTHFISSLHIYDRHYERARMILEAYPGHDIYDDKSVIVPEFTWDFAHLDNLLKQIFWTEERMRSANDPRSVDLDFSDDPLIDAMVSMLHLYTIWQRNEPIDILLDSLDRMTDCDMKRSAIEYFNRMPERVGHVQP